MMRPKKHNPAKTAVKRPRGVPFGKCKTMADVIGLIRKEDSDLADRIAAWHRTLPEENRGGS